MKYTAPGPGRKGTGILYADSAPRGQGPKAGPRLYLARERGYSLRMIFVDRPDGRRLWRLKPLSAIMPYIMRGRNESAVYFSKDLDVENAIAYVHRKNAESGQTRYSLFGLVLAAALRTIAEKPELNRFVHRRAIYERNHIAFSFIVKKRLTEEAPEANVKLFLDPRDTIAEATDKFNAAVAAAKEEGKGADEREIDLVGRLPGGKAVITSLFRLLDRFNAAPASMIRGDPLFASAYFANLGSLGLDAPFHHAYEWGTASLFVVLGRMFQKEAPGGAGGSAKRHFINVKITADERISEGIYFAHAASLFQRLVLHPELLESPPGNAG